MNIFRYLLLLLIPTLITLTSCGSDDDDNGGTAQTEEDGNTTGTTTGDGGGSGCLSATQRNRVRGMFDRAALQSPILGRAVESFRNPDGTFDTTTYEESSIVITKINDNTWQSNSKFCETGGTDCSEAQSIFSIAGTCYTEDNITGRISNSSTSGFTVTLNDTTQTPPLRETSTYRVPGNGRVRLNSVYVQNGLRVTLFNFVENPGGGTGTTTGTTTGGDTAATAETTSTTSTTTTGGDTGASTGDTTTTTTTGGDTGTTTGDTGTTTTSGMMNGV